MLVIFKKITRSCPFATLSILFPYGEDRDVHRVLVGKPEGKRSLERPRLDGRIILRWFFRKLEGVLGTGWN
jgi:hypothetical protein